MLLMRILKLQCLGLLCLLHFFVLGQSISTVQKIQALKAKSRNQPFACLQQLQSMQDSINKTHPAYHAYNQAVASCQIALGNYTEALGIQIIGQKTIANQVRVEHIDYLKGKAVAYYYLRKRTKALEYLSEAIRYQKQHNLPETALREVYNAKGAMLTEIQKFDTARFYLHKAIQFNAQNEANGIQFSSLPLRLLGTSYFLEEKFEKSRGFLREALQVAERTKDTIEITGAILFYGDVLLKLNEPDSALYYYKLGEGFAKALDLPDLKLEAAQHSKLGYEAIGDYESAYKATLMALSYQSEVYQKEMAQTASQMEVTLETANLKQQNLTQEKEIVQAQATTNQYILISAILVLLLLFSGFLGAFYYKRKQLESKQAKQEATIKLQDERLRISKDLHDNIGAQITVVTNTIDNLVWRKNKANGLDVPELKNLAEFTRQTMSDLRETVWAMKEENISSKELCERIEKFITRIKEVNTNLDIQLLCQAQTQRIWEPQTSLNILRILQEAIQNAIKHAGPTCSITVHLDFDAQPWQVKIMDNGVGFSKEAISQNGNGLYHMHARAEESSISFTVNSKIGTGTEVILQSLG